MLKFSAANAKTSRLLDVPAIAKFLDNRRKVYSLDLLSGWSCPFAHECLSKAYTLQNGKRKIKDGKHTKFRCFSASQEVQYTNVYRSRKHNFDTLRHLTNGFDMASMIAGSMPKNLGICRIHVAGDFFNQDYFDAWCLVAIANPNRLFYAYTKSLNYWLDARSRRAIPKNFVLTASYGGRLDCLIRPKRLRHAKVIFSEAEAGKLDIDHDDSHAANPAKRKQNFALLLHGTQPKGSEAATALSDLKGKGSYKR